MQSIGDEITLAYGKALPKSRRQAGGAFGVYGANGVKDRSDEFLAEGPNIIIGRKGSAGEITFVEENFWPLDVSYYLDFDTERHDLRYLYYLLVWVDLPRLAKGVKPGINRNDVYSQAASFPPLEEQRRIVALLDEAFAGLDTAIANTEKNLANARELFDVTLEGTFSSSSDGQVQQKLSDIIEISHGFAFKSADFEKSDDETQPIVLTPGNYTEYAELDFSPGRTKRLVSPPPTEYLFEEGELTVVMTDLSSKMKILGKPAFIERGNILHNQRIGRIRFKNNSIHRRLIYYFMQSRIYLKHVRETATGTMVRHTAPKRILQNEICVAECQNVQENLVNRLDDMAAFVTETKTLLRNKIAILQNLKQSILQRAVSGELTTTDSQVETNTPEFTAQIIAFVHSKHTRKQQPTFGRVKAAKTLHIAESIARIELGRNPEKWAAGPHDESHLKSCEDWAEANEFFRFRKRDTGGYDFVKLTNYASMLRSAKAGLKPYMDKISGMIEILAPMNSRQVEVFATVHAAWNNLILDNKTVSDDAIVHEARSNWHDDKMNIAEQKFRDAIRLIRQKDVVPDGTAKRVSGQESLF